MKIKSPLKTLAVAASLALTNAAPANGYIFSFDKSTDQPVQTMATGETIDGTSSVMRHLRSVKFDFNTRELIPDNVYTLWIMHYDKPEKCFDACNCTFDDFVNPEVAAGAIGAMAGRVADPYGQVSISNVVNYGEMPQEPGQILFPGEIKDRHSHFTLVLRDHGPASPDPVILEEQLTSWAGGCTNDNPCEDVVISDHPSPFCRIW